MDWLGMGMAQKTGTKLVSGNMDQNLRSLAL